MLPSKRGSAVCGRRSICRSILGCSGNEWETSGSPDGCIPVVSNASAGDVAADDVAAGDVPVEEPASAPFVETSRGPEGADGGGESWGRTMRGEGVWP